MEAISVSRLSIAPMVDHSDRHFRYLMRLVVPRAAIYTEMLVAQAIVFGDAQRLLRFSSQEHPVIAQIAGADPQLVAHAAQIVESFGYDAVNLNIGCPSKRVHKGGFGACLMERPNDVCELVRAMKRAVHIPVTVKCRIGTDRINSYESLKNFVEGLVNADVDSVVVHARIANLSGRSTRYNLNVPPLQYDVVQRLQHDFPSLPIVLNGGIASIEDLQKVESWCSHFMVGRLALKFPRKAAQLHDYLYQETNSFSAMDIAKQYREYVAANLDSGVPLVRMTRHMLSLFNGMPGARKFRQFLSTHAVKPEASIAILDEALCIFTDKNSQEYEDFGNNLKQRVAA